MHGYLKEATATTIRLGPFVDLGDNVTYEVAMAAAMNHADTGVRISKNGGAFAARTTLTLPVYDSFGYYLVNLDATDTATVGRLKVIYGDPTTCLPVEASFTILPTKVYNSIVAGSDNLEVDAVEWIGTTLAGTANVGDTTVKITLTGGVATDNYYNGQLVVITGGTGVGQARTILKYLADGTAATPTRDWSVAPDGTSTFVVIGADVPSILEAGVAQAGAAATITLDSTASATTDIYKNNFISISGGTGAGQTRLIAAYNGGTKVATVLPNWTTNPAATSIYQVLPMARVDIAGWAGNVVTGDGDWAALKAETVLIVADTNELQTDWANGGRLDLILDIIAADTTTDIPALIATAQADLNAITGADGVTLATAQALYAPAKAADVNAQVLDVLNTDTFAEPAQGAPAATTTIVDKIGFLYKAWRNKSDQNATTYQLYNDNASTVDHKATVSDDDTTFTRGEVQTGP